METFALGFVCALALRELVAVLTTVRPDTAAANLRAWRKLLLGR
jgi:hypothetical protein